MKTIICLIGRQNSGKTSSIREVYKSITGNYPDEEGDFNGTYLTVSANRYHYSA